MPTPAPFELELLPPSDPDRGWRASLLSIVLHGALILALLLRATPDEGDGAEPAGEPQATEIAIQPPDQREAFQQAPQPAPPQPQPAPPDEPVPLGPNSNNPDALVPKEQGPETPPPDDVQEPSQAAEIPAESGTPPTTTPTAPPQPRIPTPRDLASGLPGSPTSPFGPGEALPASPGAAGGEVVASAGAMGRVGLGNRDTRDWRPSFPEAAGRCPEIPDLGRNPDGSPVLASVLGRVIDERGAPLAGAHLQIVGHTFVTFSDGRGDYRLEFDPRLLERCRVQYVRVTAAGHKGQLLTLAIGRNIRSDDVVMRRR
ncbi:MAG TPA: carboxypeptidase-like regulatory domain-containing protein [Gemmatimonadales bacterium]|nr:carboxypeptidase-like regulatory domain-containing protein [Gemmatimonadales bacterium]